MYWNGLMRYDKNNAYGLTLTWDVLKWRYMTLTTWSVVWLTLTWDVLKSLRTMADIPRNGLTLTWDVLK